MLHQPTPNTALDALRSCLSKIRPGPLADEVRQQVLPLLGEAWPEITGGDAERTEQHKLARAERLTWAPPLLHFAIERHGAAVLGSKFGELHHWSIDVTDGRASIVDRRRRLLRPLSPRLDIKVRALQTADLIDGNSEHPSLKWYSATSVRVLVGEIVSNGAPKQTVTGRRKRFRLALQDALRARGWEKFKGYYQFHRTL